MKFEGELDWILGMRVTRNRTLRTICLDQSLYVSSLCFRFGMDRCETTSTPASPSESLTSLLCPSSEEERAAVADFPYRSFVGAFFHAVNGTRPDIAFAVNVLARFVNNPGKVHVQAAKRVLRYLSGTANYGIRFVRSQGPLVFGLTDADWAGDQENRRSTLGLRVLHGGRTHLLGFTQAVRCRAQHHGS